MVGKRLLIVLACLILAGCTGSVGTLERDNGPNGNEKFSLLDFGADAPAPCKADDK